MYDVQEEGLAFSGSTCAGARISRMLSSRSSGKGREPFSKRERLVEPVPLWVQFTQILTAIVDGRCLKAVCPRSRPVVPPSASRTVVCCPPVCDGSLGRLGGVVGFSGGASRIGPALHTMAAARPCIICSGRPCQPELKRVKLQQREFSW